MSERQRRNAAPKKERRAAQAVQQASRLPAPLVYEVIRRDGQEELERPWTSLLWSGLAAGILISFSVLGEAMLRTPLPDAEWRPLIENIGYSFGFLLVILGRMQLFTENTIITVLPLSTGGATGNYRKVLRLWVIVLLANIAGAYVAALFIAHSGVFDPDVLKAVEAIAAHLAAFPPWESFLRAIPAGILIAAIVWMLPSAGGSGFWIILLFTYLIALGEFTHVIAGAVEVLYLFSISLVDAGDVLFGFLLPVFAGNVIGGTVVFTLLAWGQVKREVPESGAVISDSEADDPSDDGEEPRRSGGSP